MEATGRLEREGKMAPEGGKCTAKHSALQLWRHLPPSSVTLEAKDVRNAVNKTDRLERYFKEIREK